MSLSLSGVTGALFEPSRTMDWSGVLRTSADSPVLRIHTDLERPAIPFLSWDTEGGDRARINLLRHGSGVSLRVRVGEQWRPAEQLVTKPQLYADGGASYRVSIAAGSLLVWFIHPSGGQLALRLSAEAAEPDGATGIELVFPFDPRVTPTTALPSAWTEDRNLVLPAVISAPDFGQMLLESETHPDLKGRLIGSRENQTVDLVLELPLLQVGAPCKIGLTPVHLQPPKGMEDQQLWRLARRGWFNAWQSSSKWGGEGRAFNSPAGILANNVISDPCSMSLPFYADAAYWIPEIARGISIVRLARQSAEWWMERGTSTEGVVTGYWDYQTFLDANTGPLLTAWDYVEATGDDGWLERWVDRLELIADYLARRDADGDGLVEATQSGNPNTLSQPARGCSWWDALNSGHKDGYTNAVIYRAWRCLADLESRLGRRAQQARYDGLADRLKAAYASALYNPKTGWFAWWRSADGQLHDYATPVVNGMAVEYGLVPPEEGKRILDRLWKRIHTAGFHHFELGLPCALVPVHRSDYLLPDSLGCPKKEDGADTFGTYMNGGITAGQVLHFLAAHYVIGEPEKADPILRAMLRREVQGEFENGVRNKFPEGVDWTTWDGKPCGYEGYLADVYLFLQAIVLREASLRRRYYRPLGFR